jgi:hypothetical protein
MINKFEWQKAWRNNKERLVNMLNVHNVPDVERSRVLEAFEKGFDNDDPFNMIRCIDMGLGWGGSHYSYDFYHFLQMRYTYYMCFYAPIENEKKMAVKYLGELVSGYKSKPTWMYSYRSVIDAKLNAKPGDMVLTLEKYNQRKGFFRQKFKILSKKFGIKE